MDQVGKLNVGMATAALTAETALNRKGHRPTTFAAAAHTQRQDIAVRPVAIRLLKPPFAVAGGISALARPTQTAVLLTVWATVSNL